MEVSCRRSRPKTPRNWSPLCRNGPGAPFYAHTLARAAADLVRGADDRVLGEHVDAAFQQQLLDRDSTLAIYVQYLLGQADGVVRGENIPEIVLPYVAEHEGCRVSDVAPCGAPPPRSAM